MTRQEVQTIAKRLSQHIAPKFGLSPQELAQISTAIAWKESRFNPNAENNTSTARGLMQVLINTQRETEKKYMGSGFAPAKYKSSAYPEAPIGNDRMFDPEYNMLVGMSYLAYQLKRYGDTKRGVHAYNQGSYPGKWRTDGVMYSDSVHNYLAELPIDDFKNKGFVTNLIEKIKPTTKNITANSGKTRYILNANGIFY